MNDKELQQSIAQLIRAAPASWEKFMAAYRIHCHETLKQVISSPPETIQVAQGRAKHADELLRLLDSALATAEQIEKRK